ncbi:MAG: GHKL domain-containing protein [Anaerostipes sp.]
MDQFSIFLLLILNGIGTLILSNYMELFLSKSTEKRTQRRISYAIYFVGINIMNIWFQIPILMLLWNIGIFFVITFGYESGMRQRMVAVIVTYLILMLSEEFVILFIGNYELKVTQNSEYRSIAGMIVVRFVWYFLVKILSSMNDIKNGIKLPVSYWICICFFPLSSIGIVITMFSVEGIQKQQLFLCILLLVLANIMIFYLYQYMMKLLENRYKKKLVEQENHFYMKQIEDGNYTDALSYLQKLEEETLKSKIYVTTGNVAFDSILNYKVQQMEDKDIECELTISIPKKLEITAMDLTILFGNLLDNAMEAVNQIRDQRRVRIDIKYDKGRLIFLVENRYIGNLLQDGQGYVTTKKDKEYHGIGLKNIHKIVEKYDGNVEVIAKDGLFTVRGIIFMDEFTV